MIHAAAKILIAPFAARSLTWVRARPSKDEERRLIVASGLFDENWYREKNALPGSSGDAVMHYIEAGAKSGKAPHPLFDAAWYRKGWPDPELEGLTPLAHFILFGKSRSPHPLFDPRWYRRRAGRQFALGFFAFRHFLHVGGAAGVSPHPLFDSAHYFSQDPSLAAASINPLTHFVECGALQNKNPNPFFDVSWYLNVYREVHRAGINPLVHFVTEGASQGLQPHPDVDIDQYIRDNADAPRDRLSAYVHLVTSGRVSVSAQGVREPPKAPPAMAELQDLGRGPDDATVSIDLEAPTKSEAADLVPPMSQADVACSVGAFAGARFVSFDLWDTVLRRDCHPDEIKLQSARLLLLAGHAVLRPAFRDVLALFRARIAAENAAAPNEGFEYRFENAIAEWFRIVMLPSARARTLERLRHDLIRHELAAERRSTRADPTARAMIGKARRPCIFVSDFYMSERFLTELLDAHGLRNKFVKGYASSDLYKTKRSGQLFEHMLADIAADPGDLVHIGDNPEADVAVPERLGIKAIAFEIPAETSRRKWYRSAQDAWVGRSDLSVHNRRILALLEQVAGSSGDDSPRGRMARIGARLAPVAFGYCLSVIEHCVRNGVDKVHFLTREGLFFRRMFDAVVADDPYNLRSHPESAILHVSRRAVFAASLGGCAPSDLMRMWAVYSTQSPRGLALSLNLDPELARQVAATAGLDFEQDIGAPWENARFAQLLAHPDFKAHATARIEEQRELLLAYLDQQGALADGALDIVDIGWRGSIQDGVAQVAGPGQLVRGHYLGLQKFLSPQAGNVEKHGWLFDENAGRFPISDVAPLEMIFNAPGGTVIGYAARGGSIVPVTEVVQGEEAIIAREVAWLQEGLMAAVAPLCEYVRLHGLTASELRPLAQATTRAVVERPPSCIADAFYQLHHNETFGLGRVERFDRNFDFNGLVASHRGSALHAATTQALHRARWRQGAVRQSSVGAWWQSASQADRSSLPISIAAVHAPAIVKATGSRLAIYVPPPLRASGGHRTIFNMVRKLASIGFTPHVLLDGVGEGVEVVEDYLGTCRAQIHTTWRDDPATDVAFATVAGSASHVASRAGVHHRAYLVQDFEAAFNPVSDAYVVAENSYALGLQHFTIGNWLSHVIRARYGGVARPAGLGVDTAVYECRDPDKPRQPSVCFLYQPDKARRMPVLGLDALRIVKRQMPEAQIYLYGSDLPLSVDFDVENLGLIRELTELNRLYNTCTVGLCISGSNPSRIPYEMMAGGCVPVDLYRYNNLLDHAEGTILLAFQDAASTAEAILTILRDRNLAAGMSRQAREFTSSRTLEWEVDAIANNLLALMDGGSEEHFEIPLSYAASPVIAGSSRSPGVLTYCDWQRQEAANEGRAAQSDQR